MNDPDISLWIDRHGHEFVRVVEDGDYSSCRSIAHHRLIAYADGQLDEIDEPLEVDHVRSIPWLNYAANLEAVPIDEHGRRTRVRARERGAEA